MYQNEEELSPGYITAMTKAHFLDGSVTHGIKFFGSSVENMASLRKKREDYLVNLFDAAFGEYNANELSYEDFRKKYLQSILLSE